MKTDKTKASPAQETLISAVRVRGGTSNKQSLDDLRSALRPFAYSGLIERDDRRGTRHHPWVIEVTLAVPFAAFFAKFGEAAGTDAYQTLRAWIVQLRQGASERSLALRVRSGATAVEVKSSLPDEALEALSQTDWSQVGQGTLEWDPSRRRWRHLGSD